MIKISDPSGRVFFSGHAERYDTLRANIAQALDIKGWADWQTYLAVSQVDKEMQAFARRARLPEALYEYGPHMPQEYSSISFLFRDIDRVITNPRTTWQMEEIDVLCCYEQIKSAIPILEKALHLVGINCPRRPPEWVDLDIEEFFLACRDYACEPPPKDLNIYMTRWHEKW